MAKLGVITDGISTDFEHALKVMSDNNLIKTLDSITKLTTIETKFVKSFPLELQDEAAEVFRWATEGGL